VSKQQLFTIKKGKMKKVKNWFLKWGHYSLLILGISDILMFETIGYVMGTIFIGLFALEAWSRKKDLVD
jgi:hypothetical protein